MCWLEEKKKEGWGGDDIINLFFWFKQESKSCRLGKRKVIWPLKIVTICDRPFHVKPTAAILEGGGWPTQGQEKQAEVQKQNTRSPQGSVDHTVKASGSIWVCVCPAWGTGPAQSAPPAFCPLVFSLLMDGPCSAPSGYTIFPINHHKHTQTRMRTHEECNCM